ncbi:MAG: cell division protein FtsA [Verrucomicrobia bacterium]|nr:cell division protein FtsA [Verrucomicrobiota bacterium]
MRWRRNIVVGLDVGTTKTCTVVGEPTEDGRVRVLGVGTAPSRGLRRGEIVDVEETVASITQSIDEAERVSDTEIHSVFAGITGDHVQTKNARGVAPVETDSNEITQADIDRAIESAQAMARSIDREILHAVPSGFIVDGAADIRDPRGLCGRRIEVLVHLVTGALLSAQNLVKCINKAGFEVEDIVFQPLAAARAALTSTDRQVGVILIDVGGGTTDYTVFSDGSLRFSGVIGLGGDDINRDISRILRVPPSKAEEIKIKHGHAMPSHVKDEEIFTLPGTLDTKPHDESARLLADIIEARYREILQIAKDEIEQSECGHLIGSGIVLTGGTCLLKGSRDLARSVFNNMSTRLGKPLDITGNVEAIDSPLYATAVGLAQYGVEFRDSNEIVGHTGNAFNAVRGAMRRMGSWFKQRFKAAGL